MESYQQQSKETNGCHNDYNNQISIPEIREMINNLIKITEGLRNDVKINKNENEILKDMIKNTIDIVNKNISNSRLTKENAFILPGIVKNKAKEIIRKIGEIPDGIMMRSVTNRLWWNLKRVIPVYTWRLITNEEFDAAIKHIKQIEPEDINYTSLINLPPKEAA